MENILSQIPQEVIERYAIKEDAISVSLYSNPKNCLGYISLPKNSGTIEVDESPNCITLTIMGKVSLSLWIEVQATHISLF
jgi:hypothetical protein